MFMPTGIVPPTGFICFVPRRDVTFLKMCVEDAAKIIISAGMVVPDYEAAPEAARVRTESNRVPPVHRGQSACGVAWPTALRRRRPPTGTFLPSRREAPVARISPGLPHPARWHGAES